MSDTFWFLTLTLIICLFEGTCRPTRCRPLRRCCPRSAPSGWRRTRLHAALCYRTARPPTARPRRAVGGGPTKRSRLPAPPATISTSTMSPDRPSSSPTRPALQSASSPSAATQMRKMTTNKRKGQFLVFAYWKMLRSLYIIRNTNAGYCEMPLNRFVSQEIDKRDLLKCVCFDLLCFHNYQWNWEAHFLSSFLVSFRGSYMISKAVYDIKHFQWHISGF